MDKTPRKYSKIVFECPRCSGPVIFETEIGDGKEYVVGSHLPVEIVQALNNATESCRLCHARFSVSCPGVILVKPVLKSASW